MIIAEFITVIILGYLLGSIPSGVLVGRRMAGVDVRQHGSGRTGTTNILRTAGKKAAVIAAGLDILKGVLAVAFAGWIVGTNALLIGGFSLGMPAAKVLAALAAIVGHIWPVFLRFRGGRGVATFFGALVTLHPVTAVISFVVLVTGAGLTRYVSVGSISAVIAACIMLLALTVFGGIPVEYPVFGLVSAVLIIVTHRDNITRLITGKERKIGKRV